MWESISTGALPLGNPLDRYSYADPSLDCMAPNSLGFCQDFPMCHNFQVSPISHPASPPSQISHIFFQGLGLWVSLTLPNPANLALISHPVLLPWPSLVTPACGTPNLSTQCNPTPFTPALDQEAHPVHQLKPLSLSDFISLKSFPTPRSHIFSSALTFLININLRTNKERFTCPNLSAKIQIVWKTEPVFSLKPNSPVKIFANES